MDREDETADGLARAPAGRPLSSALAGLIQRIQTHNVYRVDPQTGNVTLIVDDFRQPNGICFAPDGGV
jgi:sugar lactone lactonase YvrE